MLLLIMTVWSATAQEKCNDPKMIWSYELTFEDEKHIGILFDDLTGLPEISLAGDEGLIQIQEVTDDFVLFTNLPIAQEYSLTLNDGCEVIDLPIGKSNAEDGVSISQAMFTQLSVWVRQESPEDLLLHLEQLEGIHEFEKKYFIQEYFMDGTLPNSQIDGIDISGIASPSFCKCKMVLSNNALILPNGGINNGFSTPQIVDEGDCWDCRGVKDYWDYYRETNGAAKHERMYSRAANQSGKLVQSSSHGHGGGVGHGRIGFHLLCINFDRVPENCGCEKDLYLQWHYNSTIQAKAKTISVVGKRGAAALTQDLSAVIISPHGNPDAIKVLDGGDASISVECDADIKEEWFIDYWKLGLDVGKILLESQGDTGLSLGDILESAKNIVDGLGKLITNPIQTHSTCKDITQTHQLAYGTYRHTFATNEPVDIILYSLSSISLRGYGGWQCEGKVNSDFHLIGVVKEGYGIPAERHCCTPFATSYSLANSKESAYSFPTILNLAQSYVDLIYPFNQVSVNRNAHAVTQRIMSECPESEVELRSSGRSLNNIDSIILIDMSGRSIKLQERSELQTLNLIPGIYILRTPDSSEKIFVH